MFPLPCFVFGIWNTKGTAALSSPVITPASPIFGQPSGNVKAHFTVTLLSDSSPAFGQPTIGASLGTLTPAGIKPASPGFTVPVLAQSNNMASPGIRTGLPGIATGPLGFNYVFTSTGISQILPAFSQPFIGIRLAVDLTTGSPTFTVPILTFGGPPP